MLVKLGRRWSEFKALPAGERFQAVHAKQSGGPTWVKAVVVAAAVLAFAIGIVLMFIPGPAIAFFGLAGALIATESAWVARTLDRGEVAARNLATRFRRRRAQRIERSY